MNSLRLLTNGIRSHPSIIDCIPKQWKIGQRWYFKLSTPSKIPNAAACKATKVGYSSERSEICCRGSYRKCNFQRYKWQLLQQIQNVSRSMTNVMHYSQQSCNRFGTKSSYNLTNKSDVKSANVSDGEVDIFAESSKLGLFSRFKLITKMYWYVLIPIHLVASAGWLCAFYYLSQCGVDLQALVEYLNLSENIAEKLQVSSLGNWAIVFVCYKLATPARYAVTLGGTAASIKYLVQRGYIKPMPSKDQLMHMIESKKAFRGANEEKRKNGNYIV